MMYCVLQAELALVKHSQDSDKVLAQSEALATKYAVEEVKSRVAEMQDENAGLVAQRESLIQKQTYLEQRVGEEKQRANLAESMR